MTKKLSVLFFFMALNSNLFAKTMEVSCSHPSGQEVEMIYDVVGEDLSTLTYVKDGEEVVTDYINHLEDDPEMMEVEDAIIELYAISEDETRASRLSLSNPSPLTEKTIAVDGTLVYGDIDSENEQPTVDSDLACTMTLVD
ncbi:MAG: hypothetical protein H6621_00545 [Halobacteriovoraceae bacterium]|nr:hypothetical protein [Halobacteriovoraceae bacterium]